MTLIDTLIIGLAGAAALIAAVSFASMAKYLFDRGLADRNDRSPDIRVYYQTYLTVTKQRDGRVGTAFWIHCLSVGVFVCTAVGYTLFRFILPRLF